MNHFKFSDFHPISSRPASWMLYMRPLFAPLVSKRGAFCSPWYILWHGFTFSLHILTPFRRDGISYEVSKDDMRFQRYFFLSNCVVFAHFLSLNRDRRYPLFFVFIFLLKEKKGKPIIAIIHCCCRGAQLSHKFSKIPQLEVDETCIWHPGVLGKLGPGKSGPSLIWRQIGPRTFWGPICHFFDKYGPGELDFEQWSVRNTFNS